MERKKAFYKLLQFKIHLGIQCILAICFFCLGYFIYVTQLDFLIDDIRRQGEQQAGMVATASAAPIQRESLYLLEDLATKAEYSPLVAYCQIVGSQGKPLLQGQIRSGLTRADLMSAFSPRDVLVVSKDISGTNGILGQVKLGMFIDKARKEVQKTALKLVAAFAVVLGVIALFLYAFLNRLLILPVVNLSMLTETLSRGEFVTTNLDQRGDELGVLAHGFNNMSRNLKESYQTLEKKVQERTEDLNNAYHELRAIFDNSLAGIAVMSAGHKVMRANSRFAAIFGYSAEEISRLSPEKLHVSARDFDQFMDKFFSRLGEKEIVQLEYRFRKKNGDIFWSQVSAKAIDPKDLSKGVIFVLEDVSDRKKATELLRQHAEDLRQAKDEADKATRSKSEFLARMSHEIRTPMNAILGMAEMLQESGLTEEQNEYVKTFSSAGELLLGIINDILDFSKIEVGQIKLESISFDLRDLVGEVANLLVYRAEEKNIDLNVDIAEGLGQRYIGDPTRIRQVIINLVGNAIKFTTQGGVSLGVAESAMDDGSPCCLFSVKDTGIGIPKSKLHTIFESFAQADSSTTREFGGTGLGLAITKKLVELMGGEISVESEPNRGTTFFFKLPLARDAQRQKAEAKAVLPVDTRLLVLEDFPVANESISNLVRSWGVMPLSRTNVTQAMDVLTKSSGESALQAVLIDSVVDGEPGIDIVHTLLGQGMELPHFILLVDSAQDLATFSDVRDLAPLSCILRSERNTRLRTTLLDLISAGGKRTVDQAERAWKILLVDDVEANRRVVELFLKGRNLSLVQAENGKMAVEKFIQEPFDLVLMDMEMPVMDGLEATRRIRMWEKEKRDYKTPIIALTAHAFQEHRQKTIDAGCTEFLAKPIKKQALLSTIDQFCGQRESLVEASAPVDSIPGATPASSFADSPVQIDPELEDLRPLFLKTVRDFQTQIAEAIDAGDFPSMQRAGHSLKGLGSTYAVEEISQSGKIIEAAAKGRQLPVIVEAANHLAFFMDTGTTQKIQARSEGDIPEDLDQLPVAAPDNYTVHVGPEMSELIPFLMDAMHKDLALMNKSLEQSDFATIRRFGQSHKGFGLTYGFEHIGVLGEKIQAAAEARNQGRLRDLLDIMAQYLDRVEIVYETRQDFTAESMEEPAAGTSQPGDTISGTGDVRVEVDAELYELVPLFLDTMHTNIEEMRQALGTKNFDVICRHGHSQKGLGSTYGFDYLGQLGAQIEAAGMQKNETGVHALLDEMCAYLKKVQVVQREG